MQNTVIYLVVYDQHHIRQHRIINLFKMEEPLDLSYKNNKSFPEVVINEQVLVLDGSSSESKDIKTGISIARQTRPFKNLLPCEICKKNFDRPSLLKRHLRTHTGKNFNTISVLDF